MALSRSLLATGSNILQCWHQRQLFRSFTTFEAPGVEQYRGHWPKSIALRLGWQINENTRFCLMVADTLRPRLQLAFVERRRSKEELSPRHIIEPSCLKRLFNYYEQPLPTKEVKTESILSHPHVLEPDRVVFYKNYKMNEETWSIPSINIRRKLLPRKHTILFELAFYTALKKAVAMKYIADHMDQHLSEPHAFSDEAMKYQWIEWSWSSGPASEANSLAELNGIPNEDVKRYLAMRDYDKGQTMSRYDVDKIIELYNMKKAEKTAAVYGRPMGEGYEDRQDRPKEEGNSEKMETKEEGEA